MDWDMSQLKELVQWTHSKWQGIHRRMESFYIENRTNPHLININLKFGYAHPTRNPFFEYAGMGGIDELMPLSRDEFDRLLSAAKDIATNYKMHIDKCFPISSHAYERPKEHAKERPKEQLYVDDITTIDTKVIKIQNLPFDVRGSELNDVILKLFPRINYLLPADIIIENDTNNKGCKQAYISLRYKDDSLDVFHKLKEQVFGQKILQVNFSIGRPNECIWIGNIKTSSDVNEKNIGNLFEEYGSVRRVDIRNTQRNSFTFIEFDNIKSALIAINELRNGNNERVSELLGRGISVRFGAIKPLDKVVDKAVDKHAATDLRNTIRTRSRSRSRERMEPSRHYSERPGPDQFRRENNNRHDNRGATGNKSVPGNRNHFGDGGDPRFRDDPRDNPRNDSWGAPDNRSGPDNSNRNDNGGAPRNVGGSWGGAPDNRSGPDNSNRNDNGGDPRGNRRNGGWGAPDNISGPDRSNFNITGSRTNNVGGSRGGFPDNKSGPDNRNNSNNLW